MAHSHHLNLNHYAILLSFLWGNSPKLTAQTPMRGDGVHPCTITWEGGRRLLRHRLLSPDTASTIRSAAECLTIVVSSREFLVLDPFPAPFLTFYKHE